MLALLEERREPRPLEYERVRDSMVYMVMQQKRAKILGEKFGALRDGREVLLDRAALEAVEVRPPAPVGASPH